MPVATAELVGRLVTPSPPAGVLEIVEGDADTGEALLPAPHIRAVSFTGSVRVGHGCHDEGAPERGIGVQITVNR
jgi:acyl-CoA reductase-like NAD-dependent aldehyde dehydrogenase